MSTSQLRAHRFPALALAAVCGVVSAAPLLAVGPAVAKPHEQDRPKQQHQEHRTGKSDRSPGGEQPSPKSGPKSGKPGGETGRQDGDEVGRPGGRTDGGTKAPQDPPGNNGTVKIADVGDFDRIPNNSPHQSCTFKVQWYGFDEGDFHSTVDFSLHAPTTSGTLSGDSPSRVFVGEDPAGGAGHDFDAEQVYTLSFTGDPHPQQGYHVKLTIHTPYSQGSDRKSKVFWVEPCEGGYPTQAPAQTPTESPATQPTEAAQPGEGTTPTVLPAEVLVQGGSTPTVAPTETAAPGSETTTQAGLRAGQQVPTVVDAGASGPLDTPSGVAWLALGGAALIGAGATYAARTSRRGSHQA